jgi:hypothetical protein
MLNPKDRFIKKANLLGQECASIFELNFSLYCSGCMSFALWPFIGLLSGTKTYRLLVLSVRRWGGSQPPPHLHASMCSNH